MTHHLVEVTRIKGENHQIFKKKLKREKLLQCPATKAHVFLNKELSNQIEMTHLEKNNN